MKSGRGYELLDVPDSLTPGSFQGLKLCSPGAPEQARNVPEPKKKDAQWPQAEDLRKLHDQFGEVVEHALRMAREDGVREWYSPRIQKVEEEEQEDIRHWQDMFKVMTSFGQQTEKSVFELSAGKPYYL